MGASRRPVRQTPANQIKVLRGHLHRTGGDGSVWRRASARLLVAAESQARGADVFTAVAGQLDRSSWWSCPLGTGGKLSAIATPHLPHPPRLEHGARLAPSRGR